MKDLGRYKFNKNEVRAVLIKNEPWFVLKDVCDVLEIKNATDVSKRLDEDEVTRFNLGGLSGVSNIINESGLYSVILRSDKPQAKPFRKWVTNDVLPTIRKTGSYSVHAVPTTFVEAMELALEQAKTIDVQNQRIGELQPKADYVDKILNSKSLITITQIAKDYGMSGAALNEKLHELGVQYKQSGQWLLYSQHHAKGYTHSETFEIEGNRTVMNTKWAQKGRLFLYELLKENGILPTIEKN